MAEFEPMPPAGQTLPAEEKPQVPATNQSQGQPPEESDIVFETPGAKPKTLLWILISVGALIILGGGGWGVYTLLNKPAAEKTPVPTTSEEPITTGTTVPTPTLTAAQQRDQTRKADLTEIKNALETYFIDIGAYPKTTGIEKTNAAVSNLKTALVTTYTTVLPIDPQDPTFYYGYKSDGTTYELTSILEDQNDPLGEVSGSYFIQKITP